MKRILTICFITVGLTVSAQNNGRILGSFTIGGEEITAVLDEVTQCIHKTTPHTAGIFSIGESVTLDFTENANMIEIIKPDLPEHVFAKKDCDGSVPTGAYTKLQVGWGRPCDPGEQPQGDWKCGKCPALCIRWVRKASSIILNGNEGTVEVDAKVLEDQFVIRINDASILPQNGVIEIKNDEPLTPEISGMYGHNMIILKKGTYLINGENEVYIDAKLKP